MCFWFIVLMLAVANGKQGMLELEPDQPFQRVQVSQKASIQCCYRCEMNLHVHWIMNIHTVNGTTTPRFVNPSDEVKIEPMTEVSEIKCHWLILKNVRLNDTALYQCYLNLTSPRIATFTHGTFLQVYSKSNHNTSNIINFFFFT